MSVRRVIPALVVLLLCPRSSSGLAAQEKPAIKPLPAAQWIRSRTIDVKHIALDLRFDWAKKQAYGTATITLAPLRQTDRITLDAGRLAINAVRLGDGTRLAYDYDGGDRDDGLAITLDRPYAIAEELTVTVDYRTTWINRMDPNNLGGSYGKGLRFFEPTTSDPTRPRQIWSVGLPQSNRYWFPGYDAPNDWRTTELAATVERPLIVLSNGVLVSTVTNGDGTRTFRWKMDTPYANHLTAFAVGDYREVRQEADGVELRTYGFPHEVEAVQATVERLPDMARYFAKMTGVKYPFPSYAQAIVVDLPFGGTSTPGLFIQTENMIDDFRTHADFFYLWDSFEAQGMARQWFGNLVAAHDWSHSWLNESFVRYFDLLYNEQRNSRADLLLYQLPFDRGAYLGDWAAGVRRPLVTRYYDDINAIATDNYAVSHGTEVLHMLRKHLGDEQWWRAIRHYLEANAHRSVTTEDFRRSVEEATGQSMEWFFDQWVYRMGHPVFVVTKTYDAGAKQLRVIVKQTQRLDSAAAFPQVEWFQGPIDIGIDDRVERVWLEPKQDNVFLLAASQAPRLVNFDYEGTWVKELTFEKSFDELMYQARYDSDVVGRVWAMTQLGNRAAGDRLPAAEKERTCQTLREIMVSDAHWRVRASAMGRLRAIVAPVQPGEPVGLDPATVTALMTVIHRDGSWLRAGAVSFLGLARDAKFAPVFLSALSDTSDRVIYSAAIALGQSRSAKALAALTALVKKPSWKNQSLIAALAGLKELGDPRGAAVAVQALSNTSLARWRLPTSLWDLRIAAAETLAGLGKGSLGYPVVLARFKQALAEEDIHDVFNNVLLVATLGDPRGQEVFDTLRTRYRDDASAIQATDQYEAQFKEALKAR